MLLHSESSFSFKLIDGVFHPLPHVAWELGMLRAKYEHQVSFQK